MRVIQILYPDRSFSKYEYVFLGSLTFKMDKANSSERP